MVHFKHYSPDEDAVILANPGATMADLAKLVTALGERRSVGSVQRRRRALGMAAPKADWAADDIERLRKHWISERLTAAEISDVWPDRSRSSINGKVNRMGWPKSERQCSNTPRRAAQPSPAFVSPSRNSVGAVAPRVIEAPKTNVQSPDARPWTERLFGQCAYPVDGEGADTRSCCNPCGKQTYCAGHRAVMYAPRPAKKVYAGDLGAATRKAKARDALFSSWLRDVA